MLPIVRDKIPTRRVSFEVALCCRSPARPLRNPVTFVLVLVLVLVLSASGTRTRTRPARLEYDYEYHFIDYEYD